MPKSQLKAQLDLSGRMKVPLRFNDAHGVRERVHFWGVGGAGRKLSVLAWVGNLLVPLGPYLYMNDIGQAGDNSRPRYLQARLQSVRLVPLHWGE